MKTTITAAVLAMSLMSTSSAFANETQSLASNSGMQISEISMAQDFSAFDGIETFDVSKSELDEATGKFVWVYYAYVGGAFLGRVAYGCMNSFSCTNRVSGWFH